MGKSFIRLAALLGATLPISVTACAEAADTAVPQSQNVESIAAAGRAALGREEYAEAIRLLGEAHQMRPADPDLLSDLGIAYAASGEYAFGHEQLTKIMRLMAECAGQCPERGRIDRAFARLEGRLGVP